MVIHDPRYAQHAIAIVPSCSTVLFVEEEAGATGREIEDAEELRERVALERSDDQPAQSPKVFSHGLTKTMSWRRIDSRYPTR